MARKGTVTPPALTKSGVSPIVTEFQNACKLNGLQDEEVITEWSNLLGQSDTEIRLVNRTLTPQLGKILLRLFQRYQKIQKIHFYACYFQDLVFWGKLATDLQARSAVSQLFLDYAPIPRDLVTQFLMVSSIDFLSLRGNQCVTSYDFLTGHPGRFSESINCFYQCLASSTLKALDLSGCHLGNDGAKAIASVLFFTTHLRCLNLTGNRISDLGAIALAGALAGHTLTAQEVEVRERLANEEANQRVNDDGGGLLKGKGKGKKPVKKPAVKSKKGQTTKTISAKSLSFDPNSPIIPALLAKWSTVIVKDDGTEVLPGNSTLSTLTLDDNGITGIGLSALVEMLKGNTKLVNFSVEGNPDIDRAEAQKIARRYVPPPPPTPPA
jgi:hypothetical protein